jgi:ArsR family transcriptional regulator, arsenate/arsenite/antimonite-responsive transcriptional repressor
MSLTVLSPAESAACCAPLSAGPLSVEQAGQVAPLLKALADPVRLRLMSLVASRPGGEACVCDLNGAFDLSQPTISHHLKVLHEAGLVDRDKRGVWVYYPRTPAGAGRPRRPDRLLPAAVAAWPGFLSARSSSIVD